MVVRASSRPWASRCDRRTPSRSRGAHVPTLRRASAGRFCPNISSLRPSDLARIGQWRRSGRSRSSKSRGRCARRVNARLHARVGRCGTRSSRGHAIRQPTMWFPTEGVAAVSIGDTPDAFPHPIEVVTFVPYGSPSTRMVDERLLTAGYRCHAFKLTDAGCARRFDRVAVAPNVGWSPNPSGAPEIFAGAGRGYTIARALDRWPVRMG